MAARKEIKKSFYRVLQVQEDAEMEVVQAAYRSLSKKYHPDTNKSPEAEQRMKDLNEAYAILGDQSRREDYNLQLKKEKQTSPEEGKVTKTAGNRTSPKPKTPPEASKPGTRFWEAEEQYASTARDTSGANPRALNYKFKSFTALGQEIEKVLLIYGPQDVFWLARYVSQSPKVGLVSKAEIQAAIRGDNGRVFKVAWNDNGKPVYDLKAV